LSDASLPTPRETEILKVLWEIGPSGVRDVYRRLLAQTEEGDLAYNTVQTMLHIMEKKGLVSHHLEGRAFIYTPIYTRENSVQSFVDRVFDGAAEQLVAALLQSEKLSAKELEKLQAVIDAARKAKNQK
jgi:BlaI family transcriptional regulator, penicillinase repressor